MSLALGLVWQFMLVLLLVHHERGSVRWPVLKDALWLQAPRSPKTGRIGGRLWLVLVPFMLLFAAEEFVPTPPVPTSRDMAVFNTVLGEELLFRGLLLPRMQGAFGRGDWVANGVLFAAYHLHMPWAIPVTLVDIFALSYPSPCPWCSSRKANTAGGLGGS